MIGSLASGWGTPKSGVPSPEGAAALGGCLTGNLGAGAALNLTCGGGEGGARL